MTEKHSAEGAGVTRILVFRFPPNLVPLVKTRMLSLLFAAIVPSLVLAQTPPEVIRLWPNGAPGFEDRKDEPERAKDW